MVLVILNQEIVLCTVLCTVLHLYVYFVLIYTAFLEEAQIPFSFSFLHIFNLIPFLSRRNKIKFKIFFFHYQGRNFFIIFLSVPKLVYIFLSVSSPLHCLGFIDP